MLNDDIEERKKLEVEINDFSYTISENKINLNISLKITGLKEVDMTFLTE